MTEIYPEYVWDDARENCTWELEPERECSVVDEIINAWEASREPEAGAIPALYAICRMLGINVY